MRAIDSAMGATTGYDVLSDAEVDSLLAGLISRTPPEQGVRASPAPPADSAGDTALQEFAAALQAQFDYASIPLIVESGRPLCSEPLALVGTPLRRLIESAPPVELICTRELIVCMVDYRFGGPGVADAGGPLRPLGVTERRTLDSLVDSIRLAWHNNGAMLEKAVSNWSAQQSSAPNQLTVAFSVRAGESAGTLALALSGPEQHGQAGVTADAATLTLIAELARIRLSSEAAQSLTAGDIVASSLIQPIEVICAGRKLRCAHGASAGRHALRVLAVSPVAAAAEPEPTEEIEYTLELGRRQISRQALEAIEVGDLISFDQAVDAPLPLSCRERYCGFAEVVVLPDGHAIRIIEWQS